MKVHAQLHYLDGDWPEVTTRYYERDDDLTGRRNLYTVTFGNAHDHSSAAQILCDLDQLEEIAEQLVEIVNAHRHDQRAAAVEHEVAELAEVES